MHVSAFRTETGIRRPGARDPGGTLPAGWMCNDGGRRNQRAAAGRAHPAKRTARAARMRWQASPTTNVAHKGLISVTDRSAAPGLISQTAIVRRGRTIRALGHLERRLARLPEDRAHRGPACARCEPGRAPHRYGKAVDRGSCRTSHMGPIQSTARTIDTQEQALRDRTSAGPRDATQARPVRTRSSQHDLRLRLHGPRQPKPWPQLLDHFAKRRRVKLRLLRSHGETAYCDPRR